MRDNASRHRVILICIAGAFGGTAPTLLRLAIDLSYQMSTVDHMNVSVVVGLFIFAVLGCGVAAFFEETSPKRAVLLGIGLPSLLTVATTNVSRANATGALYPSGHGPSLILISHAASNGTPNRILVVLPPPELKDTALSIAFDASESRETLTFKGGDIHMAVPEAATVFRIVGAAGTSKPVALPRTPNTQLTVTFKAEKDAWYGLWYALGLNSTPFKLYPTDIHTQTLDSTQLQTHIVKVGGVLVDAAVSPDGTLIAAAYEQGNVALWSSDASRPIPVATVLEQVRRIAFDVDGRTLFGLGAEGGFYSWNAKSGAIVRVQSLGAKHQGRAVYLNGYGHRAAVLDSASGSTAIIRFWATAPIADLGDKVVDGLVALSFARNGSRGAILSRDGTVRVFEGSSIRTGQSSLDVGAGAEDLELSGDGSRMLVAVGKTLALYDCATGRKVGSFNGKARLKAVALSPNSLSIAAAAGEDNAVYLWAAPGQVPAVAYRHNAPVMRVTFSASGDSLLSADESGTIAISTLRRR